jgi:hypothetical protein
MSTVGWAKSPTIKAPQKIKRMKKAMVGLISPTYDTFSGYFC